MKTILTAFLALSSIFNLRAAEPGIPSGDTVIIELNNNSKVIIYTEDRAQLEKIQQYDLNKMIKELNKAISDSKAEKMELESEDGTVFLKDTTTIYGDDSAKIRIKVGNMELLVNVEDWEDLEEEFDRNIPVQKYTYEEDKIDRTRNLFNVDIGMANWMDGTSFPDESGLPHSVKPWGSWYLALNSVNRTWVSGPLFLEWGGGISWYSWRMQNGDIAITKGTDRVEFTESGLNGYKSNLSVPYVNLSLVPVLDFSKGRRKVKNLERGSLNFKTYKDQGLRIGLGGYAGYRVGGRSKLVYREDDRKEKNKKQDNFYLENFRYGIRAQIGYKGLDLFANYDLNNVFSKDRGPLGSGPLNAISFGITL